MTEALMKEGGGYFDLGFGFCSNGNQMLCITSGRKWGMKMHGE